MDKLTRLNTIEKMRELGMSWKDIGYVLEKNPKTLSSEWHRYIEIRDLPPKINIMKRKTDGAIGLKIKSISMQRPKVALRDYKKLLEDAGFKENQIPSKSTIQRFLNYNGFVLRKLQKKTGISGANVQKRKDWCRIMNEKPAEFWDTVIWSDETTVKQAPKGKEIFVYVHQSTKKEDLPINSQLHSGGFSVMFWGCFSKKGLGPLVALDGTMNSEKYVQLLEDVLLPELIAAGGPMVFMQDNAPCHKSKLVMDFFNTSGVDVLDWPAQSPDMNPIENLWAIIKARRQKKYGFPLNREELIYQIFDIWDNIEPELVSKLADSANKRVSEVLKLNGRISKY
jgi:transposase/DNA-binding transcriptional MerR regulator